MITEIDEVADDMRFRVWTIDDEWMTGNEFFGRRILLLTPEEFASWPTGTTFVNIGGGLEIKGVTDCDQDTRGGALAYGPLIKKNE